MKKLFIGVSILGLWGGTAFAQVSLSPAAPNTPDVSAIVLPGATTQGALIDQIATTSSVADINQARSSFGLAHIEQTTGVNLEAEIRQRKNDVSVAGSSVGDINQTGTNARARFFQRHDGLVDNDNEARVDQNSSGVATVTSGFALNARIIQNGNGNQSSIEQGGFSGYISSAISGYTARNDQTGANNSSAIEQNDSVSADAVESDVNVFQTGSNNDSTAIQSGDNLLTTVEQTGIDHSSLVDQTGFTGSVTVIQIAANNESHILQAGTDQIASVNQIGNDNVSKVDQGDLLAGDNNLFVEVIQETDGNVADVFQRGDQNSAFVDQTDLSNQFAGIIQNGTLLTATINQ